MSCMCGDSLCPSCGPLLGTPACKLCGALYLEEPFGDGFCSQECLDEWNTGKLTCMHCGKKVSYQDAYSWGEYEFCTKKCEAAFFVEEQKAELELENEAAEYWAARGGNA